MSSFNALNVYPDSDSEGEIDNTEELQIEEALKHYQRALKLHGEGNLREAEEAYNELFASAIFQIEFDEDDVDDGSRRSGSQISLVHYLAFKNRALFTIDQLKEQISQRNEVDVDDIVALALEWFATAMGHDPGDSSLWHDVSQLALVLGSARLSRYALESRLDQATTSAGSGIEALSLVTGGVSNPDEYCARLELRPLLDRIHDSVALAQPHLSRLPKRPSTKLLKSLVPFPWLKTRFPDNTKSLKAIMEEHTAQQNKVEVIPNRSWQSVGAGILVVLYKGRDSIDQVPGATFFELEFPHDSTEDSSESSPTSPAADSVIVDDNEDANMADTPAAGPAPSHSRTGSGTRKRKSTSLGVDSTEGRSRLTKRQRERKQAESYLQEQKTKPNAGENRLFTTVNEMFAPLGVSLGGPASLRSMTPDLEGSNLQEDLYIQEFKAVLQTWDDDKGNVILFGDGIQSADDATYNSNSLDLEPNVPSRPPIPSDEGLRRYLRQIRSKRCTASEAAFEWLRALCAPPRHKNPKIGVSKEQSFWLKYAWPEQLNLLVLAMSDANEEPLHAFFKEFRRSLITRGAASLTLDENENGIIEWSQCVLEIYLEDLSRYDRAKNNDTGIIIPLKAERLLRWGSLVADLIQFRPRDENGQVIEDQLVLRHLWARAIMTRFTDTPRELRLECLRDLRDLLEQHKHDPLELPNSTAMPEISSAKADREMSKLATMEYVSQLFQETADSKENDPEDVIFTLESVLEPSSLSPLDEEEDKAWQEIGRFLDGCSSMFKLRLWEKLKAAYERTNCRPKILSCTLRCLQIVISELKSNTFVTSPEAHRQFVLLRALKLGGEYLEASLDLAMEHPEDVEVLSKDELIEFISSTTCLLRLLHCYAFWEDAVTNTEATGSDLQSYKNVTAVFRKMLVRTWVLTYFLFRETIRRGIGRENLSPTKRDHLLATLLSDVHHELGSRRVCSVADHALLELVFNELLRIDQREFDIDMLQCIHCRFHLLLADQWFLTDHKSEPRTLTRQEAIRVLGIALDMASKRKVLQVAKSELKVALERITHVLSTPSIRKDSRIVHNEAMVNEYLSSSVHPLRLFGSLRGDLEISTVAVKSDHALIAGKGLYALTGKILLFPLRYQKRTGALSPDALDVAIFNFKKDLYCQPGHWETWYRLAQCYDIQLEELMTWGAEKMNTSRNELVNLERRSVLAYMMAVSQAIKACDDSPEAKKTMSSMFSDFGNRMYSGCRPPMTTESFWIFPNFQRHFSGEQKGMYKMGPHGELSRPAATKFALIMFESALLDDPDNWRVHYMIGKCRGKLHKESGKFSPVAVLTKYLDAIRLCPDKSGNEYIFEPHHKLVSAAVKFVHNGDLDAKTAFDIVSPTHFAKRFEFSEDYTTYTIDVLKKMKSADKSKWHHRMTNRLARLRYSQGDIAGARSEMASMFSNKQPKVSIWKPEFERAGRHFVFASAYTMFFVDLLEQLKDRTMLEVLVRGVRKAQQSLFRHVDVWCYTVQAYVRVLREIGEIPQGCEDAMIKEEVLLDEFTANGQALDEFIKTKDTVAARAPTYDILKDVCELKKLNQGLIQFDIVDDLFLDSYCKLYQEQAPALVASNSKNNANPMALKNLMSPDSHPADPLAAEGKKQEELALRAKTTGAVKTVTRKDIEYRANLICKEPSKPPAGPPPPPPVGGTSVLQVAQQSPVKATMPHPPPGGNEGSSGGDVEMGESVVVGGSRRGSTKEGGAAAGT